MEQQPGARIDRYVVLSVLGKGGMATVYLVRHESLPTHFALKVLDLPSRAVRDRLVAEGNAQASLKHPNIVQVHDTLVVDGCPALLLEHVAGPALDTMLAQTRFSLEEIDLLAIGILKGVRAAHQHGLVHRDLKPGNILLALTDEGFVPKIADFGLAKTTSELSAAAPSHTRTGQVMGTPAYMAPEQFKNAKDADVRADIWALGVILYELVTGRRPFEGEDLFDLYEQVFAGKFPAAEDLVPGLPVRMQRAIRGALVVERDQRIADVDALLEIWRGREPVNYDASQVFRRDLIEQARAMVKARHEALPTLRPRLTPVGVSSTVRRERRERRLGRALGVIGVGTGIAGAAFGILGLGIALVVGLGSRPQAPPGPAPQPAPVPVQAPPAIEPAPAPQPPPAVVRPEAPPPRPTPTPAPPTPAPIAAPAAPSGTFAVVGDRPARVALAGGGHTYGEGAKIPPGNYTLEYQFPGNLPQEAPAPVTVLTDRTTSIKCSRAFGSCKPM